MPGPTLPCHKGHESNPTLASNRTDSACRSAPREVLLLVADVNPDSARDGSHPNRVATDRAFSARPSDSRESTRKCRPEDPDPWASESRGFDNCYYPTRLWGASRAPVPGRRADRD